MHPATNLLTSALTKIATEGSKEAGNFNRIFKVVASHPFKMIAAFFTAPFLLMRIAWSVKNPIRKIFAVFGLILSFICSYFAGTILGGFTGFLLIATNIGWLMAVGFLLGTALSFLLSLTFCFLIFNAVSYLFLKMNTEEVLEYLNELAQ